ncbi:MAG: 2-C-methyl-D-erythritol 4-phosphate cytidylyltransferase, partial [Oscillospiraceae bacterium]
MFKRKKKKAVNVCAIIACGGQSSRMNGIDKINFSLGDFPVAVMSFMAFENSDYIKEIIVVCKESDIKSMMEYQNLYGISKIKSIVCGGETRQQSVFKGLSQISEDTDFVCIHDGARPFVSTFCIDSCIEDAISYGGACASVKTKDTVKIISGDGFIKDTPSRETVYLAQTPQVFGLEKYKKAVAYAKENNLDFTDDCQLFEAIGERVFLSQGDYKNIKITTRDDLMLAM